MPTRPATCTARCGPCGSTRPPGASSSWSCRSALPEETLPPDTELVKHIKIRSRLLSDFHGRPIDLRAGVILPRDFARQPDRRYPVRVHIGGYGSRYTDVDGMMAAGRGSDRAWMADDAPPMILIHLDGAGPLGDPYQVDSANHGPYGAAVTRELIPYIEGHFRGIGKGEARVLDGGSTGGWVALALQVFYPDFFNGAWAFCPDSVDFRGFQLVNIYEDKNAYINAPRLRAAGGARRLGRRPLHHAARVPAGKRAGPGRLVHVSPAASGAPGTRPTAPGDPTAAPSRSGTPRPA